MPAFVRNVLYISLIELCFENALGLLINNRSNFREVRINYYSKNHSNLSVGANYCSKFRGESSCKANYCSKNHVDQNNRCHENAVNFIEISFRTKFLRKASKSQEFHRNSFALLLHNTVRFFSSAWMKIYCYWSSFCISFISFSAFGNFRFKKWTVSCMLDFCIFIVLRWPT